MSDKRQPTQPKGKDEVGQPHRPVTIPVPKRSEFDRLLKKVSGKRPGRPD